MANLNQLGADINQVTQVAQAAAAPLVQIGENKKQRQWAQEQNLAAREYNAQQATLAYQRQTEMIDKANAYNSPAAQRARLMEAGLNPNLAYGGSISAASGNQNTIGNSQMAAAGSPSSASSSAIPSFQRFDPTSQMLNYQTGMRVGAETDLVREQASTQAMQRRIMTADLALKVLEADRSRMNNEDYMRTRNEIVNGVFLGNQETQQNIELKEAQESLYDAQARYQEALRSKVPADIQRTKSEVDRNRAQVTLLLQQANSESYRPALFDAQRVESLTRSEKNLSESEDTKVKTFWRRMGRSSEGSGMDGAINSIGSALGDILTSIIR